MKSSFQLGYLEWLLKFLEADPEGCSWPWLLSLGCPHTGNSAGSRNWACGSICSTEQTQISAGRQRNQTTLMWAHLHSCGYPRPPLPRFQLGFFYTIPLFPTVLFWSSFLYRSEQTPPSAITAHLILTFLLLSVGSAAPWHHGGSAGNWGLAPASSHLHWAALRALRPKPCTTAGVNSAAQLKLGMSQAINTPSCIFPCTPQSYLDNVQLGQQVAVCQGHLVAIQELARGDGDIVQAVLIDLIGERGVQVLIQLLQSFQEATF